MPDNLTSSNAALITARGNNQSIADKNLAPICGKPSLQYVIEAAQAAAHIAEVYVSTEDARIRDLALQLNCTVIDRPAALAHPDANHGDVIQHGVLKIRDLLPDLNCVTVLLGNTVMVSGSLIDLSLQILAARLDMDSVMSVWQAQDDHPYRALRLNGRGYLESFLNIECTTSRQDYPPVYYYDQGVWTFRHGCALTRLGPNPWWWMGKNSYPIIRNWVTGRDFHTQLDIDVAEEWLKAGRQDEILNLSDIREILS